MSDEFDRDERRLAGLFTGVRAPASMRRWERVGIGASGGGRVRRRWSPLRLVAVEGSMRLRPLAMALVLPVLVAAVGGGIGLRAHFASTGGASAPSPTARTDAAMAWDEAHHDVVMFGGRAGASYLGDTWTWDGSSWTQQHPAVSPPARGNALMAFDPKSGHVLLFGGQTMGAPGEGGGGPSDQTWSWDGSTWTQEHPAHNPSSASPFGVLQAAMATDDARGEVVMATFVPQLSDVPPATEPGSVPQGLANGLDIHAVPPPHADGGVVPAPTPQDVLPGPTAPPGTQHAGAVSVAPTIVEGPSGSTTTTTGTVSTWVWTGSDWQVRRTSESTTPNGQLDALGMAYDGHSRTVLLITTAPMQEPSCGTATAGGSASGGSGSAGWSGYSPSATVTPHPVASICRVPIPPSATWSWNGSAWHRVGRTAQIAVPARLATDPSGTVMARGGGGTWTWDGSTWTLRHTPHAVTHRLGGSIAPDMDRGTVVLFGGYEYQLYAADTWTWDGKDWTLRGGMPFHAPASRTVPTPGPHCPQDNPAIIDQSSGPDGALLISVVVRPACAVGTPSVTVRVVDGHQHPLPVEGNPLQFTGDHALMRWLDWCQARPAGTTVQVTVNGVGVEQQARFPDCTDRSRTSQMLNSTG